MAALSTFSGPAGSAVLGLGIFVLLASAVAEGYVLLQGDICMCLNKILDIALL